MRVLAIPMITALIAATDPSWAFAQEHVDANESDPVNVLELLEPTPGGMTSEQVVRLALDNVPTVASARAAMTAAREEAARTKLEAIPRLDLSGSYTRYPNLTQPPLDFGTGTVENPFPFLVNRYDLQANVTVDVTDVFLRILPSYEAANARAKMAEHQARAEKVSVAKRARLAFYDVLLAQGTRAVAEDSVRVLTASLADIQALAEAGVVTEADVKRAQAQLARTRVRLAAVDAELLIALASLGVMVAERDLSDLRSAEEIAVLPASETPDPETLVNTALAQRPELLALRELVGAHTLDTKSKRAQMLPSLALFGNVTYARPNQLVVPPIDEFRHTWQVGMRLSWSPNDVLMGRRDVRSGQALTAQARDDLETLQLAVILEVARAYASYHGALQAIGAAQDGLAAAELSYTTRRDLLAAGEATTGELLDAESELRRAQLDVLQAYITLRKSIATMDAALGRGLPDDAPLALGS